MNARTCANIVMLALVLGVASGCGDSDSHSHHSHEADEPHSGQASYGFEEGEGVFVSEQTREAIRLQVADVVPKAGVDLPAVPESSLLSTVTGDFVFAVHGTHFRRTEIKVAGRGGGWITVAEGLQTGDQVVTNGVRELWRIELQATKGGHACCPAEKKE